MILRVLFLIFKEDEFVKCFRFLFSLDYFGSCIFVLEKFFDFKIFNFTSNWLLPYFPALVLGKLFDDKIDEILGNPIPIAIVLVLGGVVLLFIVKF